MGRKSRKKKQAAAKQNAQTDSRALNTQKPHPASGLMDHVRTHPVIWAVGLLLLFTFTAVGVRTSLQYTRLVVEQKHVYTDSKEPMLTNYDGYYYLRLTHDLVKGNYHEPDLLAGRPRPEPVPLLVRLTAAVHTITKASLEKTAFVLPPLLASLLVLVFCAWGYELGGIQGMYFSALAGMTNTGWLINTDLGKFDTHCLNPVFPFLAAWAFYRFTVNKGKKRFGLLLLYALITAAALVWWKPGGLVCLVCPALYGLAFFWTENKKEKTVQILILALCAALPIVFFLAPHLLPRTLTQAVHYGLGHLDLVLGLENSRHVGSGIMELSPPSLKQALIFTGGAWPIAVFSAMGLALMPFVRPKAALFLSPMLALGLLGLVGIRFTIFTTPCFALGLGLLPAWIAPKIPLATRGRQTLCITVLAVFLCLPNLQRYMQVSEAPPFGPNEHRLALELKDADNDSPMVLAWWDWGYFLQYTADARTLFDGGSQHFANLALAATALDSRDPILAVNWTRFILSHGQSGVRRVEKTLKSREKAEDFLLFVLSDPKNIDKYTAKYGLENDRKMPAFLFPQKPVWIFLTYDDLMHDRRFHYLESPATQGIISRLVPRRNAVLNADTGRLNLDSGQTIALSKLLTFSPQGSFQRSFPDQEKAMILADISSLPQYVLGNQSFFDSLSARLLIPAGSSIPGIEQKNLTMGLGGVWKIPPG
jgi:dolichyl-diphosphooligosaccharide--protein glycosyltransferase